MSEQKRHLAAILFSDIVAYARLTQANEKLALTLLEEHRALVRPYFERYGGREVKTVGDAFLVEFQSAFEAVKCALRIQTALQERNLGESKDRQVRLRIGIHLGDIMRSEDGDIYGDGVNTAARLLEFADPGGICLSQSVYEQVHPKTTHPMYFAGTRRLKNMKDSLNIYRLHPNNSNSGVQALKGFQEKAFTLLRRPLPTFAVAIGIVLGLFVLLTQLANEKNEASTDLAPSNSTRVAVMPFQNLSERAEDEYLSSGMTDEVITSLSRLDNVRVLSKNAVEIYKKTKRKIPAGTLVEGSIRRSGNRMRVTAQLINYQTNEYVWSEEYEGEISSVFEIQKKIASQVARHLSGRVLSSIEFTNRREPEHAAYLSYLQGKFQSHKRSKESLEKAKTLFSTSIKQDAEFADAYGALANIYGVMAYYGYLDSTQAFLIGSQYAEKALQLDENSLEGLVFTAFKEHVIDYDREKAEVYFKKALLMHPNDSTSWYWYSDFLITMGRFEEAKKAAEKALSLDPVALNVTVGSGRPFYFSGDYDSMIKKCKDTLEMDSTFAVAYYWLGLSLVQKGNFAEAISILEKGIGVSPGMPMLKAALGVAFAKAGRTAEAKSILAQMEKPEKGETVPEYLKAMVKASLNDSKSAIQSLFRGKQQHGSQMVFVKVDPLFKSLQKEPELVSLLNEMHFK